MKEKVKEAYKVFRESLEKHSNGKELMTKKKARYIIRFIHRIPRERIWTILHELHAYGLVELSKNGWVKLK